MKVEKKSTIRKEGSREEIIMGSDRMVQDGIIAGKGGTNRQP